MIQKRSIIFGLFFSMNMAAGVSEATTTIRVAAAADLKFAMAELIKDYSLSHPDQEISPVFGSSGNFTTQIKQGAPFDLFFSADTKSPQSLEGDLFSYSVGHIVLWVPNDSKIDISKGLEVLLSPDIKKIAIANPVHAPYGRAAEEALKKFGIYEKISTKLVTGENIAQTAQFIESKAADIGIIAIALAFSPTLKREGRYVDIDQSLYSKMIQSGIIIANSKHRSEAREFRDYVLSSKGQKTLNDFGLGSPK